MCTYNTYYLHNLYPRSSNGNLKLELDQEQLKIPFLPSVVVSRSYPLQLNDLTNVVGCFVSKPCHVVSVM